MSRIGKKPVAIENGISVSVEGTQIVAKKGNVEKRLETHGRVNVKVEEGQVVFERAGEDSQSAAFWGTYRSLFNNIMIGLNEGFTKSLEINGVGYRAAMQGKVLNLQLGFSHDINYDVPAGIDVSVEKNVITIKGDDKQVVGQVAAEIREFRPPEPYKGKGVKYTDETIIRKAGKSAAK
ncbi:MAG: 50S ribosomal protein L6 [Campylobacterales bacterium]|nr:50S ribosomal protein L6 [Campylobacterales bacterium]